jgi:hypothetical protein
MHAKSAVLRMEIATAASGELKTVPWSCQWLLATKAVVLNSLIDYSVNQLRNY